MTSRDTSKLIQRFVACGRTKVSLALVATGLLSLASSAFGQYEAQAYLPNGTLFGSTNTPGDVSYTYNSGSVASAVVAFTTSPIASISYAATAFNPSGQIIMNGGGIMTYRFEVAAQPFSNVPIDFSGLFSSFQGDGGSLAGTSFTIQTVNSSVSTYSTFQSYLYGDCGAPTCLQFTTFNNTTFTSTQSDVSHVDGTFQGSLDMLTGADGKVIGSVQLFAGANLDVNFLSASATAYIDPRLEIDAAFLATHPGATLTITPGVGNEIPGVTAVPEPSTYALMLAGLALVGATLKRKR